MFSTTIKRNPLGHDVSTTTKRNPLGHCLYRLEKKTQRMIPLKRNPSRSHISTPDSGIYFTKKLSILLSSMLFSPFASAAFERFRRRLLYSFLKSTPRKVLEERTASSSRGYLLEAT